MVREASVQNAMECNANLFPLAVLYDIVITVRYQNLQRTF